MCRRLVFAFLAISVAFSVAGAELPWRFEGDVSRGPATFGVSAEPAEDFDTLVCSHVSAGFEEEFRLFDTLLWTQKCSEGLSGWRKFSSFPPVGIFLFVR